METFLKFLTVFGSIVVPLVIAFWNTRHSSRKHPKEEYAEDVKVAEKFSKTINSNEPLLVKDRITQQLFVTKKITFQEGIYFYQFHDMERWVRQYIEVRDQLKILRNSKGEILKIHHPHSKLKMFSFTAGYVVLAVLGLLPFLFIDWFINMYTSSLEAKQYLVIFNLICWPIICLLAAVVCLIQGSKYGEVKRFVKHFESNALKI